MMGIDEAARYELHRRLAEVLGDDPAVTLMNHLPPAGWADVATRPQLEALEQRLDARFERVEGRLDRLEDRVGGLEDRVGGLEDRVSGLEGRVSGLEGAVRGVQERLGGVESKLDRQLRAHIATTIVAILATAGAVLTATGLG